MSQPRPARRWPPRVFVAVVVLVAAVFLVGTAALALNVGGVRTRAGRVLHKVELALNPPPDRPIDDVVITPRPTDAPTPVPTATPTLAPGETPPPSPTATPAPVRQAVDVNIVTDDPATHFITEIDHEWCAVAATQMVLALHGKAALTNAFQTQLNGRVGEWDSYRDSKNGGWGPTAMTRALAAYGVTGYQVRAYDNRQDAMADAAVAIEATKAPVILLTWRGAHSWVMTGFKANADPQAFDDAKITGTYILDPWYPRVSTIWGPSDPPGTFQDLAEMKRNYLPWKRPEGIYPGRDGKFIAVVPTEPLTP